MTPDQDLTNDEELFLLALQMPQDRDEEVASVLAQLETATELSDELKEQILDLAIESPEVCQKFIEWLDENALAGASAELPKHIRMPVFCGKYIDFGNRRRQLEDLLADPKNKIISIVGQSGVGKTRLALEVIAGDPERWSNRSIWVNCRSVESERELIRLIACSLSDQPADWLAIQLDESIMQENLLIVLDEFEPNKPYHGAIDFLIQEHPNLRLVILSHDPIGNASQSLQLREIDTGSSETSSAFDFLVDAIQSLRSDLVNLREVLSPIQGLSAKLARLPLGLSLAAGCFAATPQADVSDLALKMAAGAPTDSLSSPQQLSRLVSTILRNVPTNELEAVQCLSLLNGAFSQDQAHLLIDSNLVNELFRSGLIQPTESGSATKFEVPESVRDQLGEATQPAKEIFVSSFEGVGQEIHILSRHGEWKAALKSLLDNLPNLLEAARLANQIGRDDQVSSLFRSVGRLLFEANLTPEFERLVGYARASKSLDLEFQVQLLGLEGANASMKKDHELCENLWAERLKLSRELGNPFYIADTLSDLDHHAYERGDYQQCIEISLETEAVAAANHFVELVASAKVMRCLAMIALGNVTEGRDLLDEVVELLPACRNSDLTPFVYQHAVMGFDLLNETSQSRSLLIALLVQASRAERSVLTGWALGQLGNRYYADEQLENAAKCYVAACKVFRLTSSRHYIRATERLAKYRAEVGGDWITQVENESADTLIQQILTQEKAN